MSDNPIFNKSVFYKSDLKIFENIGKVIAFKKGEKIFSENEPSTHIIIVLQGFVKLLKMTNSTNIMVRAITPLQLIGESVATQINRYPVSAHFITEGLIISIEYNQLKQLSTWSPNIALSMFNLVNKSQLDLFQEIENKRVFNYTQRIASFLLNYESSLSQLKYKEIAAILFVSKETFSRGIRKLKDEKLIVIENGKMELNKREILKLFL
jgi:CRP-like cAMP-binding protein